MEAPARRLRGQPVQRPSWLPRPLSVEEDPTDSEPLADSPVVEGGRTEFDAGFVQASVRDLAEWPGLEITVATNDGPVDQESLSKLLDFLWDILSSERAASGLRLTYDLRRIRVPKMTVVVAIAQWGSEPSRQSMFQERVVACSICVSAGFKFTVAKAAMKAFFRVCPPTCKTLVVTNLEGEGGDVAVFDMPGGSPGEGAAAEGKRAAEAKAAGNGASHGEADDKTLEQELERRVSAVVNHKSEREHVPSGGLARLANTCGCGDGDACWNFILARRRQHSPPLRKRTMTADMSLVRTVQDLQQTIDALTERIAQLEKQGGQPLKP